MKDEKGKSLSCVRAEDTPDHILEEVGRLVDQIGDRIMDLLVCSDPNISLAALNFFHSMMITKVVGNQENVIKESTLLEAKILIMNVQRITKVQILKEEI